jgi:excisionase family DNA binding protein
VSLLSRHDAAAYLGVSVDTLDRLRASGRLMACQVSARLVKYLQTDLDAYLDQCRTSPSFRSEPPRTGTSSGTKVDVRAASQRAQQAVMKLRRTSRLSA